MAIEPAAQQPSSTEYRKPAKAVVLDYESNEVVFGVVGHVGSGTSEIASALKGLLEEEKLEGGKFDVEILKARAVITDWATRNGHQPPASPPNNLNTTKAFQDLGDLMRKGGDHAIVAGELIQRIRLTRAARLGISDPGDDPVRPDGVRRAYILDSIRHPAEVELLRRIYQGSFVLVGVVCEAKVRRDRITNKYSNAGVADAEDFMARDAKAKEKYGQRVSDAFHMADFFVDNTVDHHIGREPNEDWDINEKLSRLIKIMTATEVVRPDVAETAMYEAYGAAMRSACLSRQVGAALLDAGGNIIATGTNEVPRAGGGVYGVSFKDEHEEDHRCAFRRSGRFCSNTREQNVIIDSLIAEVPELNRLDPIRKNQLKDELREGRVGDLLEFSRAVHAEMDAVIAAARNGVSTVGTRLFVTTFPCHYCARGLVAAGVDEVQYVEPYPKSQALALHADAITVDAKDRKQERGRRKVLFCAFTGVAPRLYRRAFLKDRDLKNSKTGEFKIGTPEWGSPWQIQGASYVELEAALARTK